MKASPQAFAVAKSNLLLIIGPLESRNIRFSRHRYLLLGAVPGGGVLPYIRYIGMCGPKGYGF